MHNVTDVDTFLKNISTTDWLLDKRRQLKTYCQILYFDIWKKKKRWTDDEDEDLFNF